MPREWPIAGALCLALVLFACDASAAGICPPGASLVKSGNSNARATCVRGAFGGGTGRVQQPGPSAASASCPHGTAETQTDSPSQPYACVPVRRTDPDAPGDCMVFNAGFSAFYRKEADDYDDLARKNFDEEGLLEELIADRETLGRDLKRESLRSRDPSLRRHYAQQARAVDRDARSRTARLGALRKNNRAREHSAKSRFRSRAAALLESRPAGCPVQAAKNYLAAQANEVGP